MILSGTFKTFDNEQRYTITIGKSGNNIFNIVDPTENIYGHNHPAKLVMFAPDPVTINCDRQDLMKRIIISQATINLYSDEDLTNDLFADTNRDIPVTITLNGNNVFYGYVDPLQFNQGYAYHYESITISATDELGALEDKYVQKNGAVINPSAELAPWTIITTILNDIGITNIVDSTVINGVPVPFINTTVKTAMQNTKIHCKIFYGDSQDDYKSYYDVLDNICKYFNLYIAMSSKNTVIITSTINNIVSAANIANFKDLATDDSTSLSTDDAYSQITLTCNIESEEQLVTSFDDSDMLYSDYDDYSMYMTEYISTGEGEDAWNAFRDIMMGNPTKYDAAYFVDHWCYVFRNDAWDFGENSYIDYCINQSIDPLHMTKDQRSVLTWLAEAPCRAALVGFAELNKVNANGITTDNSLQKSPTLDKCLVISTNGHLDNSETEWNRYQTILDGLMNNPICTFRGIDSTVLSPSSSKIVNFIVINGSIILNPLQLKTGTNYSTNASKLNNTWDDCKYGLTHPTILNGFGLFGNRYTVPYPGIDDGAYYNQYWYYGENTGDNESGPVGIYGFFNNSLNKTLQYKCSKSGENDVVSKMPVLCCQMKVTTTMTYPDDYPNVDLRGQTIVKYCVERLDGGTKIHSWTNGTGENVFEWLTLEECTNNNLSPVFTIGIDPKIDDYIIGQKFPISNSVDWRYNLDKTGMCIPVHLEDQLSGTIEFSIIGPYNAQWNVYTFYPLLWMINGHTYKNDTINILSNIQSIMLSDLKVEMTSNNGGISRDKSNSNNDLVYFSTYDHTYTEVQDNDIDICTCLTPEAYEKKGIKIEESDSFVIKSDNTGFFGWPSGDTEEPWNRPEECYVDYLYKEYGTPARILDTQLTAEAFTNGLYGNSLNYDMLTRYYTGIPVIGNCRLMSYTSDLKYKTIDCKFRQHKTIDNQQI